MPVRAEQGQFPIEVDADAAAHAHDHRLAVERLDALLEMRDDIPGDEPEPGRGAHDGLELRPLRLQLLLALGFLALGDLLETGIDPGQLGLVQRQLRQPALEIDRHGRPVLDGPFDVVDADVVAEHRPRVGVLELNRRAGEADERGVGQRVPHVAGIAVDEVVLAAVRLVGDHDDVPAPRQLGHAVALFLGKELLDRREHDAARLDVQLGAQVGAAPSLRRRLPQQVPAAGERAEELVVEVVAIRQHDDRRVLHRRLADDPPGVERHGQALARALGVPDDADPAITGFAARSPPGFTAEAPFAHVGAFSLQPGRSQRLVDGRLRRVELVVSRHLLGQPAAAVVLEDDEVPHQRQEPARLARPLDHHAQLGQFRRGQRLAADRPPGHPVERPIAGFQRRTFGSDQLAERVVKGLGGQVRVQPVQRGTQSVFEHRRAVVGPLGGRGARRDVRSVEDRPAEAPEPLEGGGFDLGLGEGRAAY